MTKRLMILSNNIYDEQLLWIREAMGSKLDRPKSFLV